MHPLFKVTIIIVTSYFLKLLENVVTDYKLLVSNYKYNNSNKFSSCNS